jgi:hypothetical protein
MTSIWSRRERVFWAIGFGFIAAVLGVYLLLRYLDHGLLDVKIALIFGANVLGLIYCIYRASK